MILGGWSAPPELKRHILAEQIRWAEANGAISKVSSYLLKLPGSRWYCG